MSRPTYIPGVCNIGPAEIRARRASGLFGLGITIVMLLLFYIVPVEPIVRLLIFLPAALAAAGLLQARLHFCANFGMRGLFNVGEDMRHHESVDQADFRRKDQHKAIIIISGSAAVGLVVALAAYWLPFAA